jgi:hypothetical protein
VEQAVVKAVAKYAGVKIFVNWDDANSIGDDSKYKISINKDKTWIPGMDESMVRDFLQDTRSYLQKNSGHGDLDEDNDFLYSTAVTGARNAIKAVTKDKNRRALDVGGAGASGGAGDGGRAGGRRDLAVVGGEGGGSGGAGMDVAKADGSGAEKVGRFTGDRTGDYKGDHGYSPDDLIQAIRANPAGMTNDPEIQQYILRYAHANPMIAKMADHLIDNDLLLPGVEHPHGNDHGTQKYEPAARPVPAHAESHQFPKFSDYLRKKGVMNEMGVVWGNDPKSSKTIKPGQTLKGGIQVQGAPWSASGNGDKTNDVRVK